MIAWSVRTNCWRRSGTGAPFQIRLFQPDQRRPERNRRYRRTANADQDATATGPAVCRRGSRGGSCRCRPHKPSPGIADKPSIAVLPFLNLSGDPEQEYFIDGIVEDIITALSRNRAFFVIARNSSFTYKGKPVDTKQVAGELGVRYVLEGSVRKSGDRVRVTGQFIEAKSGRHLWADRFDGDLVDIFDLQDQLVTSVVGAIAPQLERAEIDRAKLDMTDDLAAYDFYLRGLASWNRWTGRKTPKHCRCSTRP